jgi:hypothetical protein
VQLNGAETASEADGVDMTEVAAAMALLRGKKPPSGRVVVPASVFPFSEQIKKDEAKAAAFAEEVENAMCGDQMSDGTFYLGIFIDKDGEEKNWFVAAEDAKDGNGERLMLDFNEAAQYAKDLTAHGHNDWMVPPTYDDPDGADDILKEMYDNPDEGFEDRDDIAWYWSSSADPDADGSARLLSFFDGCQTLDVKDYKFLVRCVRSAPIP